MRTSIVIPVKDDEYIFCCLDSLLKITFGKTREILVINDQKSSKEFSSKLVSFCKEYKIRCIKAKKPGASFNRNEGMRLARGENILFIDSDCLPDSKWISEMEKSLKRFDIVEGSVIYNSKERTVLDRSVENINTPNLFLTANLGIKKKVSKKCKFDERFIVFREDTDFGLSALENDFKSTFNKNAIVYHKQSKFSVKRFIFERERYIGEPLFYKKHQGNPLIKNYISKIWRFLYPAELLFSFMIFLSLFFSFKAFLFFYLFPGVFYLSKKYYSNKYAWSSKDSILVLLLLPITMFVKRIAIWRGAFKSKFFVI